MIVYWIILQFLQGFGSAVQQAGAGIAYFAHIGGFFSGLFLVRLFRRN
jgi:membrane associated rhomboid family serine protease